MLALDQLHIWQQLDSPYGNSADLPSLLSQITENEDIAIVNEIIWDYIYHQGSVYQNTLATVPHLLATAQNTHNIDLKMELT